jgi:hypothetical protein
MGYTRETGRGLCVSSAILRHGQTSVVRIE